MAQAVRGESGGQAKVHRRRRKPRVILRAALGGDFAVRSVEYAGVEIFNFVSRRSSRSFEKFAEKSLLNLL